MKAARTKANFHNRYSPKPKEPFFQKKESAFSSREKEGHDHFFSPVFAKTKPGAPSVYSTVLPGSVGGISPRAPGNHLIQKSGDLGTYEAEKGDSFQSVAMKLGITVQQLVALNSSNYKYDSSSNVTDLNGKIVTLEKGVMLNVPNKASLPVGEGDTGKLQYVQIAGSPFLKGGSDGHVVDPNDVDQGTLGDCSLMSGMAAIARANPGAIHKLIKELGKGRYSVTLYIDSGGFFNYKKPHTEIVSDFFPGKGSNPQYAQRTKDTKNNVQEIWPMLLEKALAQYLGGYDKIESQSAGEMMEYLTGKESTYYKAEDYSEMMLMYLMYKAVLLNFPVTVSSKDNVPKSVTPKVADDHSYAPLKVDIGSKAVDLYNPWGHSHLNNFEMSKFKKVFEGIQIMDGKPA